MDEWIWMKIDDIRKYEAECAKKQNAAVAEPKQLILKNNDNDDDNDHDNDDEKEQKN